jgi:hypothetical protein
MIRKYSKQKDKMGHQYYLWSWKNAKKIATHANNLTSRSPWLPVNPF